MIFVTYKNHLRLDKKRSDFLKWLKIYWPEYQKWGATSYKLWNDAEENRILYCRYSVENYDRWQKGVMSREAEAGIQALDGVVDLNRLSMKITIRSEKNA